MITDDYLFLRGPNPSVYILVLFQRSTSASAIREILSGRIQRTLTLSEVLEEYRANVLKHFRKHSLPSNYGLSTAALEEIKKHNFDIENLVCDFSDPFIYGSGLYPSIDESVLLEVFGKKEVQVRQVEHEIITGHDTIITLDSLSRYNDEDNLATPTSLLRKEVVPKEEEQKQGDEEFEIAKSHALGKIGARVEQIITSPDLYDVFNNTVSFAHDIYNACKKGVALEEIEETLQQKALQKKGVIFSHQPKQEKALQPPDLSEIPLYRGHQGRRRQGSPSEVRPLDFLKTHYGQYLSAFGAEENRVYQDQIRAHDRKLIEGVKNQLRAEGKGRKVSDFVKTRSARVDRELENVSVEDLKRKPQLAGTLYSREKRAADKAKAPSRSRSRNS
jgi:hypothetical protein